MPISEWGYVETVGKFFESRFKTELETELSLKICSWGDLEQVFTPDAEGEVLATMVPAIFIQPMTDATDFTTINARRCTQDVDYRIIYVDRLAEGVTHESNRMRIRRVKDVILANPRLDNPAITGLTNAQVVWVKPIATEFRPVEDLYVAQAHAWLIAAALVVRAKLILKNVTA
jgi:hypothetical protein